MAWVARRAGALSASGAVAAAAVGAASVAAGWGWGALLIAWFVASSALTRVGTAAKAARTRATLPAGGTRTAIQVAANGGLFAVAALAGGLAGSAPLQLAALGALAAAAADTWATEIGLWSGATPRSIVTGQPVEAGLSGGITWVGSLGGAAGAWAVAVGGAALLPTASVPALTVAGIVGGLADSLLGATVQAKRRCPRCRRWTERATHDCGVATEHGRGWRWMTNDTVNLLATFVGAVTALLLPIA